MIRFPAGFDGETRIKRYADYYQAGYGVSMLSSGFDPRSLFAEGQQGAWYDPSDFTTLFKDTAGTDPVTTAGDAVALIRDKSGRGNHASQSTLASRPTIQQDSTGRWFLLFDGVDDVLVTASINFSGTNKVTAISGVRKLSDAADGVFLGFGSPSNLDNGSFQFSAPGSGAVTKFEVVSRGTATAGAFTTSIAYNAPFTGVVTGIGDIAAPSVTLRINKTQVGQNLATQGTGQYGNYALRLGRRPTVTQPFNGRIYSVIVCGALLATATLNETELFVNAATGAF